MRKLVSSLAAAAILCLPTAAVANHTAIPGELFMMEFDSMEECEDSLAQYRNMQRKSQYKGREAGQYNKDFNARYMCVERDDDTYVIDDMMY